ncbi:MAG: hypothetical protein ABFC34_02680 [Methanobacterium sp.]
MKVLLGFLSASINVIHSGMAVATSPKLGILSAKSATLPENRTITS